MKIRLLESFGNATHTFAPGEEVDVDKAEAKQLIEAGIAEPVGSTPAKRASTRKAADKG
jgi:hypothetical protein